MKKLLLIVFIIFVGLFSGISYADKCTKGNCENGQGTYVFDDGSYYVGQFKNGRFDGYGTAFYVGGQKASGQWKNGILNISDTAGKELYSKPHYWLICASTGYSSNFPPSLAQAMLKKFKLEAFDDESRCADTAWSKNQMANQMGISCGCQFMTLDRQKAEAIVGKERMP